MFDIHRIENWSRIDCSKCAEKEACDQVHYDCPLDNPPLSSQHLVIDGKDLGGVIGYRQNREMNRWVFLMEAGYYISVDWCSIHQFNSAADLEIFLNH